MRSLFPDDEKRRDKGIGGLASNDSLSRSEQSALRSLGADELKTPSYSDVDARVEKQATGGTGRTVQPGAQYASVFTINKGNLQYLMGERPKPVRNFSPVIFSVVVFMLVIGAGILINTRQFNTRANTSPIIMIVIFAGFGLFALVSAVLDWRRHTYFVENGQLLVGEITSADGKWVWTGSGKSRSRKYQVSIEYRFRKPNGQMLDGIVKIFRSDMARKGMPEPGTQIAALYVQADDRVQIL